ncbi:MAG: TIGR01777 family oxidoreductase [Pseudomonadota bacterium]
MNVFITGGTGFVGGALARHLAGQGHDVTILTRTAGALKHPDEKLRLLLGDPTKEGVWQETAGRAKAVINLAGSSIFRRWAREAKLDIQSSRLLTTRNLVEAMATAGGRDKVLLSTSAVGYYGSRGEEELTEITPRGEGFLAELSQDWEAEALKAEEHGVRVCLMRFGVVLAGGGGALSKILKPFRLGLGGRLGHGRQWFSWIHRQDLVRAAEFLLNTPQARGPFNFTAPGVVRNKEFTLALGQALGRPTIIPLPGFMVKSMLGEFGSVLLEGQKVMPKKLLDLGFKFQFPTIYDALAEILRRAD